MQCEICGGNGANQTILMDGAELLVCMQCSAYGKVVNAPPAYHTPTKTPFNQGTASGSFKSYGPKTERFDETPLIGDFGMKLKGMREKKGLTVKELAEKLFEKESVLHKIEQQKHPPENRLIEKLEKYFGIELRQKL